MTLGGFCQPRRRSLGQGQENSALREEGGSNKSQLHANNVSSGASRVSRLRYFNFFTYSPTSRAIKDLRKFAAYPDAIAAVQANVDEDVASATVTKSEQGTDTARFTTYNYRHMPHISTANRQRKSNSL